MSQTVQECPHCGAKLHYVGDAFCSECRNPLETGTCLDPNDQSDPSPPFSLTVFLPFNLGGVVITALSFWPALGICYLLGDARDGMKLVIGGPLAFVLDLAYRSSTSPSRDWFSPSQGGKWLYLPLWMFGIFWTLYGVWQLMG